MLIHLDLSRSSWWGLVTCKQFDSGQTRETGADLDPNHLTSVTGKGMGSGIFFVFLEVCSLSDLANIADPDQMLRHVASGRTLKGYRLAFFLQEQAGPL